MLAAARADGSLRRAQAVAYDSFARCLGDALRNLDLSYHPVTALASPGDELGYAAGDWEEEAALAAELGGGLVAGSPGDMAAFAALAGAWARARAWGIPAGWVSYLPGGCTAWGARCLRSAARALEQCLLAQA